MWETRFLRCDALTSVTRIPLDDTVSTGIYAPTYRGQPLLSSSGFKNAPEGGGSQFMWNSDICLPTYKCHILGRMCKKRLFLLYTWVHFLPHGGNFCLFCTALLCYFKQLVYRKSSVINTPICLSLSSSKTLMLLFFPVLPGVVTRDFIACYNTRLQFPGTRQYTMPTSSWLRTWIANSELFKISMTMETKQVHF